MSEVDASIPLQVKQFAIPDPVVAQENAMKLGTMKMEYQAMQQDQRDSATMGNILKSIDPKDPNYDDKAYQAMLQSGINPQKALAFKSSQLSAQKNSVDIEAKKAETAERQQQAYINANKEQRAQMEQATAMINDATGGVTEAYDSIINKGGDKNTAMAAAKTILDAHIDEALKNPNLPDQIKKQLAAEKNKPFNIDQIREEHAQSAGFIAIQNKAKAEEELRYKKAEEEKLSAEAAKLRSEATPPSKDRVEMLASMFEKDPTALTRLDKKERDAVMDVIAQRAKTAGLTTEEYADKVVGQRGEAKAQIKTDAAFSSGTEAKRVTALNTAVSHLALLSDDVKKLDNNDTQALNKVTNYIATQFGHPEVTNFETAKKIVASEVIKAIAGTSGGGVQDREEMQRLFDNANSPAQLKGAIDQAKKLLSGQLGSLRLQYTSGSGTGGDKRFNEKLNPETVRELEGSAPKESSKPTVSNW